MSSTHDRAPAEGTLEEWALAVLHAPSLEALFATPTPPRARDRAWTSLRVSAPSRPTPLVVVDRAIKTHSSVGALRDAKRRVELLHTFAHHELQAAELMCWAILAFSDAPDPFLRGLGKIADDELRHLRFYDARMNALGSRYGALPVRDWFWQRISTVERAEQFVATMSVGFEGANLDHTLRYAALFDAAGDSVSAALQRVVHEEELPHVRFGLRWLRRLAGSDDFERWSAQIAPPLTALVMRGVTVERTARQRAGMSDAFVTALEAVRP